MSHTINHGRLTRAFLPLLFLGVAASPGVAGAASQMPDLKAESLGELGASHSRKRCAARSC